MFSFLSISLIEELGLCREYDNVRDLLGLMRRLKTERRLSFVPCRVVDDDAQFSADSGIARDSW
jgi:hypothetical protein